MPNATRRQGREWALQMLVVEDLNPGTNVDEMIPKFWDEIWEHERYLAGKTHEPLTKKQLKQTVPERIAPKMIRDFAEVRVRGVLKNREEIDKVLQEYAANWSMYRIGSIERNVLRLGYYELKFCPDVPPPVVLNEAIDLANYFCNSEAGSFVNGILDKIFKDLQAEKPAQGSGDGQEEKQACQE